ncbi:MAG: hypothetical protein WD402_06015 [Chloroflexota bacterium]
MSISDLVHAAYTTAETFDRAPRARRRPDLSVAGGPAITRIMIRGAVADAAATWLMDIATTDECVDANGWSSEATLTRAPAH